MTSLAFNCGEFKPGKPPVVVPPIKKPGGGVIIVVSTHKISPVRPAFTPHVVEPPPTGGGPPGPGPGTGSSPKLFECRDKGAIQCPPFDSNGITQITITPGILRKCEKCTTAEIIADIKNHNETGEDRKCINKAKCETECKDLPPVCRQQVLTQSGFPTGDAKLFKCVDLGESVCPSFDSNGIPQITVTPGIKRKCRECTTAEIIADIKNHNVTKQPRECVDKAKCETECKDLEPVCRQQVITGTGVGTFEVDPITTTPGGEVISISVGFPGIAEPGQLRGGTRIVQPNTEPTRVTAEVVETRNSLSTIEPIKTETLIPEIIDIEEFGTYSTTQNASSLGSTYHRDFTLFSNDPTTSTIATKIDVFQQIFQETVAEEVAYVLSNHSNIEWSEKPLNRLSTSHIAYSLQPRLLSAFNNIKNPDDSIAPVGTFLEMIRKLLVTNRLDEVNPQYYINLAESHSAIPGTFIKRSPSKSQNDSFALGILAFSAVSVDFQRLAEQGKQSQKRYRPLLEDIETNLIVEPLNSDSLLMPLGNVGISATNDCLTIAHIHMGEGVGNYVSATRINSNGIGVEDIPLVTQSETSSAFFAPAGARSLSMSLLNIDPTFRMTVSAPSNQSEFEASGVHTTSSINEIGYFVLNQSSVVFIDNGDPLVDLTTAVYDRVTDQVKIDRHAKDYGFGIVRANIDYRDVWYQYAMNSSSITVQQNDIGYQNFKDKRAAFSETGILVRNLPQGYVFVPGKGSDHNPYGSNSRIVSVRPTVIREIIYQESFLNTLDPESPPLQTVFSGDESGDYHVGLVEKQSPDTQTLYYKFDSESEIYSGTYYSNQEFSSSGEPYNPATTRMISNIFDQTLRTKYNIDSAGITWWDLYRRMTLAQFAELDYETDRSFYNALKTGWRGHRVREVLNRSEEDGSGLLSIVTPLPAVPADFTYLTLEGRRSAQNS